MKTRRRANALLLCALTVFIQFGIVQAKPNQIDNAILTLYLSDRYISWGGLTTVEALKSGAWALKVEVNSPRFESQLSLVEKLLGDNRVRDEYLNIDPRIYGEVQSNGKVIHSFALGSDPEHMYVDGYITAKDPTYICLVAPFIPNYLVDVFRMSYSEADSCSHNIVEPL